MTVGIAPDHALLQAVIEQVWSALLFTPAEPWPGERAPQFETGLQAQIELRGDWNGRLVLTCDREVAAQIAGAMLGADADEALPEADVHDAVGEVLNVVGGSVKGALGGTTSLGLPGVRPISALPAANEGLVVSWRGEPVLVHIVPENA
jgi:chemotaxis protein CheX